MQQCSTRPSSMPSTGTGPSPPVLILDIGTRTVKSGLYTLPAPRVTPSIIGTPRYPRCLPGPSPTKATATGDAAAVVVGHDARRQRGLLRLVYPVQHGGAIIDWEDGVRPLLRQSVRGGLAASVDQGAPATHAPLDDGADIIYSLVESPFASRPQRAHLAEMLFEGPETSSRVGPRAAGVFCGVGPLLALYATGQTTGLVVDVGDGGVSTAAAVDGYALPLCLQHDVSGASGAAATSYLTRLLYQSGVLGPAAAMAGRSASSTSSASMAAIATGLACSSPANLSQGAGAGTAQERELVYDIKEACCSVATTPLVSSADRTSSAATSVAELNAALISAARQAQQLSAASHVTASSCSYALPDGRTILVGAAEAVQAAEVLFYPSLLGLEGPGVVDAVLNALIAAPTEVQATLLGNVILSGGPTSSAGFAKRVFCELQQQTDTADAVSGLRGQRICVTAPEQRAYAGWLGASFVAQLSTFVSHMVVTRAAYEEEGEAALAKKILT